MPGANVPRSLSSIKLSPPNLTRPSFSLPALSLPRLSRGGGGRALVGLDIEAGAIHAARVSVTGGLAVDLDEGRRKIADAFSTGRAAERFAQMVAALGGPADFVERPEKYLPAAPIVREVYPERAGIVQSIDTRAIGIAVVELGGGRRQASDAIDPAVGFTGLAALGAEVGDNPIAFAHARDEATAASAARAVQDAYRVSDASSMRSGAIVGRISGA